jgi:hypothetical protein
MFFTAYHFKHHNNVPTILALELALGFFLCGERSVCFNLNFLAFTFADICIHFSTPLQEIVRWLALLHCQLECSFSIAALAMLE